MKYLWQDEALMKATDVYAKEIVAAMIRCELHIPKSSAEIEAFCEFGGVDWAIWQALKKELNIT